jgi:hypothetical protein
LENCPADLAETEQEGDVGVLAQAARFIDLLIANMDVRIPDDIRALPILHGGRAQDPVLELPHAPGR